jgi:hypothetical protein
MRYLLEDEPAGDGHHHDAAATIGDACREYARNVSHDDPDKCRCRGGGWILSDWDTWHQCPEHFNGQRHPEDYDDY